MNQIKTDQKEKPAPDTAAQMRNETDTPFVLQIGGTVFLPSKEAPARTDV